MPGCGALLTMAPATSTRSTNIHRVATPRPCQPIACVFPAQGRGHRGHLHLPHQRVDGRDRLPGLRGGERPAVEDDHRPEVAFTNGAAFVDPPVGGAQ